MRRDASLAPGRRNACDDNIALEHAQRRISESVAGHPNKTAHNHPTSRKTIANPTSTNQRRSGTIVPARNRHQVKLHGYELVRCEGRISGVGNQFQKRAPARIAHDSHISPGSLRLHVDQVSGLGNSDERRIGRVTQPQPYEALS